MTRIDRRGLLAGGLGAGLAGMGAAALPAPYADAASAVRHFQHGVASGDPLPHNVVIWTRVTPTRASTPGSGRGPHVRVGWQVSTSPSFRRIVRHGTFATGPWRDHTVKLDVHGLRPATWYYYRFTFAGQHSRVGRMRTAPAATASPGHLRFGVVSCANLQAGWFSAYRHLAERTDLHAVIHLGDYFYEYGPGEYGYGPQDVDIRPHQPAHEVHTLADYRIRHAQYKRDADLQALHARYPWIVTWDDHEVANDQWRGGAENHSPGEGSWTARKRAAHRAYDEWMPVRLDGSTALDSSHLEDRIYRRFRFGRLMELSMLDLRSYRSKQVAQSKERLAAVDDPDRTIAGSAQLDWLKTGLRTSRAAWKVVGNPVMIAPVTFAALPKDLVGPVNTLLDPGAGVLPDNGVAYNVDQWDGYTADRTELFDHIRTHGIEDVVFITGDIHSAWACDLPYDSATYPLDGRTAGVEFVGTSVTSSNLKDITGSPAHTTSRAVETIIRTANRHVKYLDFDDHGYSVLDVTHQRAQMDWYVIGDRADRRAGSTWSTSWATARGSGRVHRVDAPLRG